MASRNCGRHYPTATFATDMTTPVSISFRLTPDLCVFSPLVAAALLWLSDRGADRRGTRVRAARGPRQEAFRLSPGRRFPQPTPVSHDPYGPDAEESKR
jgi:hypothetical protein